MIPFGWWPGAWGLQGKTRERAQAEYELEGYNLARRLAEIDHTDNRDFEIQLLEIELEYKQITRSVFDRGYANIALTGNKQALELLRLDHKEGKINDNQYNKETATVNGESYVTILSVTPDSNKPDHGSLELDWNDLFISELRAGGYKEKVDEEVVNKWLADLCRNIAMEEFSGVGDFDETIADPYIQKTLPDGDGKWAAS